MIIKVGSQEFFITNWKEFERQVLFLLSQGVLNKIQENVEFFRLFDNGHLIAGYEVTVEDGRLLITNRVDYAQYIEFGTYAFHTEGDSFPNTEDVIKKKDFPKNVTKLMAKGMMAFAPIRRVVQSQQAMDEVIQEAF